MSKRIFNTLKTSNQIKTLFLLGLLGTKKYNGKEFIEMHGYDTYDCGARGMYPALMRFTTPDPLAEKYYSVSPYVYCHNNPVNRIDPDGRWNIDVHAYNNRGQSGYAVFIARDRNGNEVYRTVVKTIGTGGRTRDVKNSDTPQGKYQIVGYRETGEGTGYNRVSFGPNDLLALDYQGEEGGSRNGMHVHGGRQEGKYEGRTDLASTWGCMRINDADILELQKITNALEKNDPMEKKGFLNLMDDLKSPVQYSTSANRFNAGTDQFPKSSSESSSFTFTPYVLPVDNTRVVIPYRFPDYE